MAKRLKTERVARMHAGPGVVAMATKKAATKKAVAKPAPSTAATGTVKGTTVTKMPQSMTDAATSQDIYLYANDVWAQRYFDENDLHSVERILFGQPPTK